MIKNISKEAIDNIKENENNPRTIDDESFERLVKSIKEAPWMMEIRPIVIDNDSVVIGGNQRLAAAKKAGLKEVFIIKASDLTEKQRNEFIIKDNLSSGGWDFSELSENWDIDELANFGLDMPAPTIFDDDDENENESLNGGETETKIVLGDLIEIGTHRLLCGDSTDICQVEKLLDGEKIDLLFTDPPYNVSYNGRSGNHEIIMNDNLSENDFLDFINSFVSVVKIINPKNYYIWCNWKFYGILQNLMEYKACIVWAKNVFGLGNGYRHQHEFCLFNGKIDEGIKNESDLWMENKDTNYMHPTQKPISLAARALNNHKKIKSVLDLFCGSGSTIVAAHKLKRKCYGMELDPKYCQVIINRMLSLDENIVIKINGNDYVKTV